MGAMYVSSDGVSSLVLQLQDSRRHCTISVKILCGLLVMQSYQLEKLLKLLAYFA